MVQCFAPLFRRAVATAGFSLALATLTLPASAQTLDPNLWITNGRVNALARSGNTLYAGGSFSLVGPRTGGGMPVDTASAAVSFLAPKVRGDVRVAISDGAGGWFIGGTFDSVGAFARQNLAHINADLSVAAWNPGASSTVNCMALSDNRLVVGGTFTTAGGVPRGRLACLDATTGTAFDWNPSPNGQVDGVAIVDTTVYVGGWFNFVGPTARGFLAAVGLTGGALLPWNPGANNNVNFMSAQNGRLYIGGLFVTIGVATRNRAAAFDPATGALLHWAPLVTSSGTTVTSILDDGDKVYLGGNFTTVDSQGRLRLACVDSDSGRVLPWNAQLNGQVLTMAMLNGQLHIGGVFTSVRSTRQYFAARLDTTAAPGTGEGALLPWSPLPGSTVNTFSLSGDKLYVGGSFNLIGGMVRASAVAFDLTTGQPTAFDPNISGSINTILVEGGSVYLGGSYFTAGGSSSFANLAKFDPLTGAGQLWGPPFNSTVNELLTDGTTLWLVGTFTALGPTPRNRAAAVDLATGTLLPFDPSSSGPILAIARLGGTIFLGGSFNNMGLQPRNRLAAVDAITGALLPWDPNSSGNVNALLVNGTSVIAGGFFATVGGQARNSIAELDATTGLATAWNPNASSSIEAMELVGGTLYCGGGFTSIGGQPRVRLAALDLASGLATSWNPNITSTSVLALTTGLGRAFFGGTFTAVSGHARPNLAALYDPALPIVGVPSSPRVPSRLALAPCFPNPLREHASIDFTLAASGVISADLLDVHGRRLRSLISGRALSAGHHSMGIERDGLAAGVYFIRLRASGESAVQRFVVMP